MSAEERTEALLAEMFDSVLREKGDKLAISYLSDVLQAVKELRLIAIDIETEVDSWEEARLSDTEIHTHQRTGYTVEAIEENAKAFAASRREAAHALREGCVVLEKEAVEMVKSCLALGPPLES